MIRMLLRLSIIGIALMAFSHLHFLVAAAAHDDAATDAQLHRPRFLSRQDVAQHRLLNGNGNDETRCDIENNFFYRSKDEFGRSPWWFFYTETFHKDFTPYVDPQNDGMDVDHTLLLNHFRATCEISEDGVLYTISGSQTCSGKEQEGGPTTTYSDTNLPFCIRRDCIVDIDTLKDSSVFNYCSNGDGSSSSATSSTRIEFNYQMEEMDSLIGDECRNELRSFNSDLGYGLPDYLWAILNLPDFCTLGSDGEICDFNDAVDDFNTDCNDQGGILYKYSDFWVDKENNYTSYYLNQPLCMGKSCNAETYFEKFIFPHNEFDLSGTFYKTSTDGNQTIATYEYDWTSYERVGGVGVGEEPKKKENTATSSAANISAAMNYAVFLLLIGLFYL